MTLDQKVPVVQGMRRAAADETGQLGS